MKGMDRRAASVSTPRTEEDLEALLSEPSDRLVAFFRSLTGRLMILGIGGKIGITLGMAAARAAAAAESRLEVVGVSRFSEAAARARLEKAGVSTVACDLLDAQAVASLPDADYVIFMAGRKFGTSQDASLTWAMNTLVPANVARRYQKARIVVFSTGCVYPLVRAESGGCTESIAPAPVGEYAQSALARERVFEYFSRSMGTPVCLFRLNYAIDLRYGVLHDIARQVKEGVPVDLAVRTFNCIWQGDVIERALLCLNECAAPPVPINISGPETVSVRTVAEAFGAYFGVTPIFVHDTDPESPCYLCNAGKSFELFGYPRVTLGQM
ncbi:MAG: NAD(P)-dependent oxidoreductase, partial [Rectinema sp.]|nr:NAD(P)-dependent oxidoreductase [Rectinema sp.]